MRHIIILIAFAIAFMYSIIGIAQELSTVQNSVYRIALSSSGVKNIAGVQK